MMDIPDYDSDQEKVKVKSSKLPSKGEFSASFESWNDMYLKQEVKNAIRQCGFQHPSEVQRQAIPNILQGRDILCQAKSGLGKTAVFVISILNQITEENKKHSVIVIAHTRELAHQISKDFKRLSVYLPFVKIGTYHGGEKVELHEKDLKEKNPQIIVGTPGRLLELTKKNAIHPQNCQYFVIDQCDKIVGVPKLRADVQDIFLKTPHQKQVMMFTATLSEGLKVDCKKFLQNEVDIFVDEGKLTLHKLEQFFTLISQEKKLDKLTNILDNQSFNQAIIFVNKINRAKKLTQILKQQLFNPICIHSNLKSEQRIKNYDKFKQNASRILVATDLIGRGIDLERVDLVINYDFPPDRDSYLHRVGRAGRFETSGTVVNFVRNDEEVKTEGQSEQDVLKNVQEGFKITIRPLEHKQKAEKSK